MIRKSLIRTRALLVAAVLAFTTMACGIADTSDSAAVNMESDDELMAEATQAATLEETMDSSAFGTSTASDKEETVYVMTDANGAANKVIVSEWLRNSEGTKELTDATDLSDVKNVKGNSSYTTNEDGTITWNTNGSDVYYQGTSDKQVPVEVKVTYYLDGQQIDPEELAGKSGQIKIRFDYVNNDVHKVDINGKETDIYTPYAMVSGAMLDTDHFSNVEVTNGKVISEGNNFVVLGVALPGLKESLDISPDKLDELEEKSGEELEIPDYVEITADATDFKLDMTMTMATGNALSDLGFDGIGDSLNLDDAEDKMDELTDGTEKLVDGSGELYNGSKDLQKGTKDLYKGTSDLYDGTQALVNGALKLQGGTKDLVEGAAKLKDGTGELATGAKTLKDGTGQLASGAGELKDGTGQLVSGAGQLKDGTGQLVTGAGDLKNGTSQLATGAGDLKNGTSQLATGAGDLKNGTAQVAAGAGQLKDGAALLDAGAGQLAAGTSSAKTGADTLAAGAKSLDEGAQKLANGLAALDKAVTDADISGSMTQIKEGLKTMKGALDGDGTAANPGIVGGLDQVTSGLAATLNKYAGLVGKDINSDSGEVVTALESAADEALSQYNKYVSGLGENAKKEAEKAAEDAYKQGYQEGLNAAQKGKSPDGDNKGKEAAEPGSEGTNEDKTVETPENAEGTGTNGENNSQGQTVEGQSTGTENNAPENSGTESANTEGAESVNGADASAVSAVEDNQSVTDTTAEGTEGLSAKAVVDADIQLMDNLDSATNPEQLMTKYVNCKAAAASYTGLKTMYDSLVRIEGGAQKLSAGIGEMLGQITEDKEKNLKALAPSIHQLSLGAQTLSGGLVNLDAGAGSLSAGLTVLDNGAQTLKQGTADAVTGSEKLAAGATQVDTGAGTLKDGAAKLDAGAGTLKDGAGKLDTGASTLVDGVGKLDSGAASLVDGAGKLDNGAAALKDGAGKLDSGTQSLLDGANKLNDGMVTLYDGTGTLNDGALELYNGSVDLDDGAFKLYDGAGQLNDGAITLMNGAKELADGLVKFDDEGISKLTQLFDGDLQDLKARLDALSDASRQTETFGGAKEGTDTSVKYIIKTAKV